MENFLSVTWKSYVSKGIRLFQLILFTAISISTYAQQEIRRPSGVMPYLEYLPADYSSNSNLYPAIIFLHGSGERGTGSDSDMEKVKKNGPPKHIKNGHKMCFEVNGVEECFIVISPQTNRWHWDQNEVHTLTDYIISNYRIDPKRVHITGLSMGGEGTYDAATNERNLPSKYASIAPIAGTGDKNEVCRITENKLPVWHHHGDKDNTQYKYATAEWFMGKILDCGPDPEPIFTVYAGVGHNAWDRAYKTDNSLHNPNLYQWFLMQNLDDSDVPPQPRPVTVDAGSDMEIALPNNSVTLTADLQDPDGIVASTEWIQMSGTSCPLAMIDATSAEVIDLMEGNYTFVFQAIDTLGNTITDEVQISVTPSQPVVSPVTVDAGEDVEVMLPHSSIYLQASISDPGNIVISKSWSQSSGSTLSTKSIDDFTIELINLKAGSYAFEYQITDVNGDKNSDEVVISILECQPDVYIVDNTDPSFSIEGNWVVSKHGGNNKYFEDYYHDNNSSKGSSVAKVEYPIDRDGEYEVFAWWYAYNNRSTNTPFIVHHDQGVDSVFQNQKINNATWVSLGKYSFTDLVKVHVSNYNTNGYVIADAFKFEEVLPEEDTTGIPPSKPLNLQVVWNESDPSTSIFWTDNSDNETGFVVERKQKNGTSDFLEIANLSLNSTQYTDYDVEANSTLIYRVAAYNEYGKSEYSNEVEIELTVTPLDTIIVDNDDPGFSQLGNWTLSTAGGSSKYGTDYYHDNRKNKGQLFASFTAELGAGSYEIFGWWYSHSNRANNTKFEIEHNEGVASVTIDQSQKGGQWVSLGIYEFDGTGTVTISNEGTSGYVVADAIKFQPVKATSSSNQPVSENTSNEVEDEITANVTVYPNPFVYHLNILIETDREEQINIMIYNGNGDVLSSESYNVNGSHQISPSMNLQQLPQGYYYVKVTSTSGVLDETVKVMKNQ